MAGLRIVPLTEPWVCETECAHRDCAEHRLIAKKRCYRCGEQFQPEQIYYRDPEDTHLPSIPFPQRFLTHAKCLPL